MNSRTILVVKTCLMYEFDSVLFVVSSVLPVICIICADLSCICLAICLRVWLSEDDLHLCLH